MSGAQDNQAMRAKFYKPLLDPPHPTYPQYLVMLQRRCASGCTLDRLTAITGRRKVLRSQITEASARAA